MKHTKPLVKPSMRGVLHGGAFFVALAAAPAIIAIANGARLGTAIYALTLAGLFGVSALYHVRTWKPTVRKWIGKIDHTMIFLLIAGTFTPFALVSDRSWARVLLAIVWIAAGAAILIGFIPIKIPKSLMVVPYMALGWFGVAIIPSMWKQFGAAVPLLIIAGGALYTMGAVVYARRKPNPNPAVFGYHEIFHAFVVVAAFVHYAAVALAVGSTATRAIGG